MSYRLTTKVIGAEELKRAFQKAPQTVIRELSRGIAESAAHIEGLAKHNAPIDQGILRASIHTEGPRATASNVEASVGTDLEYARYQEDPERFRGSYDDLLSSCGLGSARDLGARFGIDVADEAFWTASLDVIRRRIDEFVDLAARS